VKIRQPIQLKYEWVYLFVVVEPVSGKLHWCWLKSMKSSEILSAVGALAKDQLLDALIWDGAGSHRDESVRAVDLRQIVLPPYSPELNPAERFFQELRAAIEGQVYPTLAAKIAAVEAELADWDAHPEKVRDLIYYPWIQANYESLLHRVDSPLQNAA
jgi:hypothetical protein